MYNTTVLDNATNALEIAQGINTITSTHGLFSGFILLIIYMVILISGKNKYDTIAVMVVAGFIVTVLGIIFYLVELIGWKILIMPIILLIGSVIVYLLTD